MPRPRWTTNAASVNPTPDTPVRQSPAVARRARNRARIDWPAVRLALAAAEVATPRPAPTGKCHECDRQVSGERLYCGRCLATHKL